MLFINSRVFFPRREDIVRNPVSSGLSRGQGGVRRVIGSYIDVVDSVDSETVVT